MFAIIRYEDDEIIAFRARPGDVARVLEPGTTYGEGDSCYEALEAAESRAKRWREVRGASPPAKKGEVSRNSPCPTRAA